MAIFLIVALFVYNLMNNVKPVSKTVHNLPGCKGTDAAQNGHQLLSTNIYTTVHEVK